MEYRIYYIENQINKKVYIGYTSKSLNKRFENHIKNAKEKINRRLYDSMNHHGYDNFKIYELDKCIEKSKAGELESWYIYLLDSKNHDKGYNMTCGGDGGYTLSEWNETDKAELYRKQQEKREQTFLRKYGVKTPMEVEHIRKKVSKKLKGRIISDEQKLQISRTLKEKGIKPPVQYWIDKPNPRIGSTHTDDAKKKISEYRSGKTYDEIYDKETSNRLKNKKSNFWKGKGNPMYIEDYAIEIKISIIKKLIENIQISKISKEHNTSPYKIRQFLKEFGITNIQKVRRTSNYKVIMENILQKINHSGK